jgi:hypothetical protein
VRGDRRDCVKLKSFCTAKETVPRMDGRKSLPAIHLTGDWFPEYIKNSKISTKRTNDPTDKWANELSRQFSKEEQMPSKHENQSFHILSVRERQVHVT